MIDWGSFDMFWYVLMMIDKEPTKRGTMHRYELGTVNDQQDWWWFGQRTWRTSELGLKFHPCSFGILGSWGVSCNFGAGKILGNSIFAGSHFWPTPYAKLIAQTASLRYVILPPINKHSRETLVECGGSIHFWWFWVFSGVRFRFVNGEIEI